MTKKEVEGQEWIVVCGEYDDDVHVYHNGSFFNTVSIKGWTGSTTEYAQKLEAELNGGSLPRSRTDDNLRSVFG